MGTLSLNTKLAYWVGQLAEGLKNTAFAVFLLFYYNQVLGVSGTLCGIAIFVGIFIDAITDPLMGSISDGWRSKYGRRHPFMYVSALPLGLCFFLLFNPTVDSETGLFVWLLVFAALTRFAMTLYHVPHIALGAEMTSDYHERNVIAAFRMVFNSVGALTVYALGFLVFFASSETYENGQLDPEAYPPFTAILGVGMCLAVLVTSFGTQHLVPHLPKPRDSQQLNPKQILNDMGLACFEPRGAFYCFPSVSITGMSDETFSETLLMEEKVAVVPGSAFGQFGVGHVRICYAADYDDLVEAMKRLRTFVERHTHSK
ncbi:MAG: aminotransferase class I/II-fold pyridoxal phosphate-dependent enzyme [Proteobacteria bacterium]|nr:aminotransferase class I/II-fold pyridoxal phosphate-dependent enzyme [Pseudomonadota bacterium]